MHPRRVLLISVLATLTMLAPQLLFASSTGRIKGTIVDNEKGAPLSGITVQVDGTIYGARSDFEGEFFIFGVPAGEHTLVFSSFGYETVEKTNILVEAGKTTEISVVMKASSEVPEEERGKPLRLFDLAAPAADALMKSEVKFQGGRVKCIDGGSSYFPPAHGGTAIVNGQAYDAMFFKNYGVNPFVDTEDDSLSTFAIDVDDASYIMMRSYIERGNLPPDDAIRVEEFVNHFDYGYDPPYSKPFDVYLEGSPSKFGQNCYLLRIGIKGKEVRPENRKSANLVFVIDVSGSMGREDRLALVRKALRMLVDELRDDDRVGIVVYGSRGQELLPPTSVRHRDDILRAIECLVPSGSTNAEEGIDLGYAMADRVFEPGKINRIILCSDGVANVGRTGPDDILKKIKKYADKGITLSAVGFGMGNYNDILMEKLGNKGNGSYAYVDDIAEARRIFVDNLTGNLQVIARDVKIQVEFDPRFVRSYRLLGYENRDVEDAKFRDDKEDGGEIGAGHSVTALYEIKLRAQRTDDRHGNIGTIYIRHKNPDDFEVTENSFGIDRSVFARTFNSCSPQFRLAAAAAEFAEILRKSYWAKGSSLENVLAVVKNVNRDWENDDVLEMMHLVSKAAKIQSAVAEK
jgi:Ca-activated chloride channel family protein